jgi:EAL domain-containing protein (putative c-di-GMP-specific phosphodiesterase class I)
MHALCCAAWWPAGRNPHPARAAGRRTVAEFVADQDTLELLAKLGVDLAQGFQIGRPRPLEEL